MNLLRGRILEIQSDGHISLVDVAIAGDTFTAILLESPQSAPYLAIGKEVKVLFKETEVSLAKELSGRISLRNCIQARVVQIRDGVILSEVVLDYGGKVLSSIITSRAVKRLDLGEGDQVSALIKANEVSLMEVDNDL